MHEGLVAAMVSFFGSLVDSRPQSQPVLRFDLVDREERTFEVKRMTYRGDGGWSYPLGRGPLRQLVERTVPHLGRESFFDLR